MYLSKLELHGFKSFADRTVLQFDPGITAVVGPNGCGKSNIIDAVRWVLGAQRPTLLRSKKMENVIFNGTADRRPLGMAEVELTVENTRNVLPTEYSEVTVGRRLYRSGDSEYLLNDVECRLKDIEDLFMDTGMGPDAYSVIELKMVDDILSNTGDSRRTLFEEAAGITKYKQRRKQALRKLEDTQDDLTRVRDITSELETQVKRLKKQADTAARYKKYRRKLRRMELQHAKAQFEEMTTRRAEFRQKIKELEDQIEALTTRQNKQEAALEDRRTRLTGDEQELANRQQTLNERVNEIQELESEVRLQKERRETARRRLERLEEQTEEAAERRRSLEATRDRLHQSIEDTEPEVQALQESLSKAVSERDAAQETVDQRREELQAVRETEEQLAERRSRISGEVDRLQNRIELLQEEHGRVEEQLETFRKKSGVFTEQKEELERTVAEAETRVEQQRESLEAAEKRATRRKREMEDAREELQQLERAYDALAAEVRLLESLVSSYDEYGDTVKFLAESNWTDGAFQTVADLLACDPEDRLALHTALGAYRSCIVVASEREAERAIEMLRQRDKGQATFLVLERFQASHTPYDSPPAPDTATPVLNLVRILEPRFESVAEALVGDCFIVDSLDDAQAAAARTSAGSRARFIARTGEWVDAAGTIHGGGEPGEEAATAHRLGRREQLENTRQELEEKGQQVDRQTADVQQLEETVANIPLDERREELEQARSAKTAAEQKLQQISYERQSLEERQQEQRDRLREIEDQIAAYSEERTEKKETLSDVDESLASIKEKRREAASAFDRAEAVLREAQERYNETRLEAVQARNNLENLEREKNHTEEALDTLAQQEEQRQREARQQRQHIQEAKEKLVDLQEEIQSSYEKRDSARERVRETEESVAQLRAAISEREKQLRDIRREREQKINEQNEQSQRLTQIETRLEDLQQRIEEEYDLNLAEAELEFEEEYSRETAEKRIPELRKKLRQLGAVNELALENYEEEKERLEFMRSQQEDLEESEEKLLETINEINETATSRFTETFEAIQSHFSDLFRELFGGGAKAEIYIDGDYPLDDPIRISAKPRGKKPSTLAQLSGGEKALTAIALLFAIYLVKPSPFCILDEVDAPLDDANVSRFMRLIRRFSEDTQFILVTHNKRTMEAADRLYGVTMQERGVSTLVGVKFDEALGLVA